MIMIKIYKYHVWMFFVSLFITETVNAKHWKLKAREHFDTETLYYGQSIEKETTSGIGPTINFWLEEPYENAFGLALGLMNIDFRMNQQSSAEDSAWNCGSSD